MRNDTQSSREFHTVARSEIQFDSLSRTGRVSRGFPWKSRLTASEAI